VKGGLFVLPVAQKTVTGDKRLLEKKGQTTRKLVRNPKILGETPYSQKKGDKIRA